MYLRRATILNNGAISDFELKPPFNNDGTPQPIVVVGRAGSGKTTFLSIVADGILEIAAAHYLDVLPGNPGGGLGRQWYRLVGLATMKAGSKYELSALRFEEGSDTFSYRVKGGFLPPADLAERMVPYKGVNTWEEKGADKAATGSTEAVRQSYEQGAHLFFPASRVERPHWLNTNAVPDDDLEVDFASIMTTALGKPIVVSSSIESLKSWFAQVILDQALDGTEVMEADSLAAAKLVAAQRLPFLSTLISLNDIISQIVQRPNARLVRTHRGYRAGHLTIALSEGESLPSLANLSAGQAILLGMFATIFRYGQHRNIIRTPAEVTGIVVVDEIDAHLHAELQHDVLPKLIRMFPKVQFIVSSHAPLFLLGMQREFGDQFRIIEMPTGLSVDVERFSEFENALEYFKDTRTFLDAVKATVAKDQKPLVLLEGETDPKYLMAAAEVLGFERVAKEIEFDWVGENDAQGKAQGGGSDNLKKAVNLLLKNPQLVSRPVLVLYDHDANSNDVDADKLHVRSLTKNPTNKKMEHGIENLLPESVIEDRFFTQAKLIYKNGSRSTLETPDKMAICKFVCEERRNADDFALFRPALEMIQSILLPVEGS